MAVTPARVVLFLIGLFVAAGLVAYGTGVFGPRQAETESAAVKTPTAPVSATAHPTQTPSVQPQAEAALASTAGESQSQPGSVQPQNNAAADANTAAPEAGKSARSDRVTPSFDVLRVEPDGSTVVAGRAKPGAIVEMLSGATVLGQTTVSPNGDFAIALDQPLQSGDHTLVLRAKGDDGSATSTEMAIVSVPKDKNGQVLAMVQEPGQPSRLISLPEAEGTGQVTAGSGQQSSQGAADQQEATTPEVALSATGDADVERHGSQAATGNSATASGTPAAAADAVQPTKGSEDGTAPTVEAVEIEGSMIYVAGRSAPGAKLRAYAGDVFLGEATASPDGQFLVEAKHDLAVGKYTIRIDAIGPDGQTVTQRAAVPFEREAGETLAAVAPSQESTAAGSAAASTDGSSSAALPASGQPQGSAGAAAESDAGATAPTAAASEPTSSQPSAASTATAAGATAPALQRANGAVIIRRGDSLWHISKRVYGRGVRYSTIYLANQDQIQNPNRIWPGQIFHMPESTTEGEKADMTRLGEQATTRD